MTSRKYLVSDLTPLVLEVAAWGVNEPSSLSWLDPPPTAAFSQAQDLLKRLEALDRDGRITGMGRAMVKVPLHPRVAHMVVKGNDLGSGEAAAELAAFVSERDGLAGMRAAISPHGFWRRVVQRARVSRRRQNRSSKSSKSDLIQHRLVKAYSLPLLGRTALRRSAGVIGVTECPAVAVRYFRSMMVWQNRNFLQLPQQMAQAEIKKYFSRLH